MMANGSLIWLTIALVCMSSGQTMGKTNQIYEQDGPIDLIAHEKMMETLEKTLYDKDNSNDIAYEVYKLLLSSSDKKKADPKMRGLSVERLLGLNTWNDDEWTEEEFELRKKTCDSFMPPFRADGRPVYMGMVTDDEALLRNLGYYCWTITNLIDRLTSDQQLFKFKPKDQEITHAKLIEKLNARFLARGEGTGLMVAGFTKDQLTNAVTDVGRQVYELFEGTTNKNEPIQQLNGHSVQELLDLNKWNINKWTGDEFVRRENICRPFMPEKLKRELNFDSPYRSFNRKQTTYYQLHVGLYCLSTKLASFKSVRLNLTIKAIAQLEQYRKALEEFRHSGDELTSTKVERTNKGLKGMCSKVLETLDETFMRAIPVNAKLKQWAALYNYCNSFKVSSRVQ